MPETLALATGIGVMSFQRLSNVTVQWPQALAQGGLFFRRFMRSFKRIVWVVSLVTGLVASIATLYFGYDWFIEDATNTEARNYFLTALFVFVAALFAWIYSLFPSEDDLQAGENRKRQLRILYAEVEDHVAHELRNLEQLRKGQMEGEVFQGTHLKAVAEYSFTEIRDQVKKVKHLWRFTFLISAILREITKQLSVADKNKRDPNKLIPLIERFLARLRPLVPDDDELLNAR